MRRVREGSLKEGIAKKRSKDEPELKAEAERMFLEEDGKHVQRPTGIDGSMCWGDRVGRGAEG